LLLPLPGFFNNGIFSGFPIYLPELYPTLIRAASASALIYVVGLLILPFAPETKGRPLPE